MLLDVQPLSPEAERRYRETIGAVPQPSRRAVAAARRAGRIEIVAEGDSWFDYVPAYLENPLRGDLLGHLHAMPHYRVQRIAKAGDTLENLVYGTEYDESSWSPAPPQFEATLKLLGSTRPDVFLFSGGGNDLAGPELDGMLNHRATGLPPLRSADADAFFAGFVKGAYRDMIVRVSETSPGTHIFLHGYDYAIPDGRAVIRIVPGWSYIGPWLRPAFVRKRILDIAVMRPIVNDLIRRLNDVLAELAAEFDHVHHIDVRGTVGDGNWANELHPTSKGFGLVAKLFDEKIRKVIKLA
jgi:hypothetical protein